MKILKCSNCGASLNLDAKGKITKCPYCGSKYLTEKLDENNKQSENKTNSKKSTYTFNKTRKSKLNIGLLIALLIFFPFAGIIYLVFSLLSSNTQNKDVNSLSIEEMDEIDDMDEND